MTENPLLPGGQAYQPTIDTSVPHTARIWNYWLGGRDNYAVDRRTGDEIAAAYPFIVEVARASRAFLARAVRYLAGEAGIRQFLDIGTGLPTADNTHEIAQAVAPKSRIVYVDNDPLVLVHARALLTSHPEGATDYIDADVRDTELVLRETARTLDLTRPVAVMLLGILALVGSYDEALSIVRRLMAAAPSGSYLVVEDATATSEFIVAAVRIWNEQGEPRYQLRSPEQIAGYLDGLDVVAPGVVSVSRWRPPPSPSGLPAVLDDFVGVAQKP